MGDHVCPCCLLRGMQLRLDKKGRPYFGCRCCSAMLFVRGGELGAFCASSTLRLLESADALAAVADTARIECSRGPSALADMLRPATAPTPLALDSTAHMRAMGVVANG
jgi:hypothetical protein